MKTARERAEEIWDALPASAQVAVDLNYMRGDGPRGFLDGRDAWIASMARSFKEHARDQRRLCAESTQDVGLAAPDAHVLVYRAAFDAPAPGKLCR